MFRFTLRDVLWLTVVVSLIAVWRTDLARQRSEFRYVLWSRVIDDEDEAKSLIAKAKADPRLFAEWKTISATERQYVQLGRSLYGLYWALFAKAKKLPSEASR